MPDYDFSGEETPDMFEKKATKIEKIVKTNTICYICGNRLKNTEEIKSFKLRIELKKINDSLAHEIQHLLSIHKLCWKYYCT